MRELICLVLVFVLLIPVCYAQDMNNPITLYSISNDIISVNMSRIEIEKVLGAPLNDPFPEPVLYMHDYFGREIVDWVDRSPLRSRSYAESGYYCAYGGNVVVQYNCGFSWDEFSNEAVFQRFYDMRADLTQGGTKYSDEDWKELLPDLVALSKVYEQKAQKLSTAVLISTRGFEFEMDDGFYVGAKTNESDDVEKYYYVSSNKCREISYEQAKEAFESGTYNEKEIVACGVTVDTENRVVQEICIKLFSTGYGSRPCGDYYSRYDVLIDFTKTTEELQLEKWRETIDELSDYVVARDGDEVEFNFVRMVSDYLAYKEEFDMLNEKAEITLNEKVRKLEIEGLMRRMESSGEGFNEELSRRNK